MIYLGKSEDRYQAVRQALNELNPVIRGTIVLKPDLPSPDAGAGAFTQISFVRAAVDWIREHGNPRRILIAEGASQGTTEELFQALGYDDFVKNLKNGKKVELFDINSDNTYALDFKDARGETLTLPVSQTVLDADFILVFSLLKTHDHVALSGTVRSLDSFIVGAENRARFHGLSGKRPHEMDDGELGRSARAYAGNLLQLNGLIEPDLVLIDGNGQEGNGPVRGNPKTTDLVLAGDDALQVDVVAARVMGFSPDDVPYLHLAAEDDEDLLGDQEVRGLDPDEVRTDFTPHRRMKQMQAEQGA